MADDAGDLETLLLQGQELVAETSRAHRAAWGLGSAAAWSLDQGDGRIVWTFDDGRTASAAAQVLGSWNSRVGTFAWSWDNPSVATHLRATAERVRAYGAEHGLRALTASPLVLAEDQVRDLVALAFRVGECTGLYHPYDGTLATYLTFGPVTVERPGSAPETFTVPLS